MVYVIYFNNLIYTLRLACCKVGIFDGKRTKGMKILLDVFFCKYIAFSSHFTVCVALKCNKLSLCEPVKKSIYPFIRTAKSLYYCSHAPMSNQVNLLC